MSIHLISGWAAQRGREWRGAMSDHALRMRVHRRGEPGSVEPAREEFSCFALCGRCGYLAERGEGPCLGCGQQQWVDLQSRDAAEMVHLVESQHRNEIPSNFDTAALVGGLVLGGLMAGAGWWLAGAEASLGAVAFGFFLGVVGAVAASVALPPMLTWLAFRRRPLRPMRWRLPGPLPDPRAPTELVAEGPVATEAELLTAPLSGRPCVGYEVTVLFDAANDRRPPMWILEEEQLVPCTVGGHPLPADGATLWLEAEPVGFSEGAGDQAELETFLRKRGLFSADGEYVVFEALLEPGAAYRVVRAARPAGAVPALVRLPGDRVAPAKAGALGPRDALAVAYRRKRRLATLATALLLVGLGVAGYLFLRDQIPPDTTYAEELAELQKCDLSGAMPARRFCKTVLVRALRRLRQDPETHCGPVREALSRTGDWEKQNRLLNLLLRYRRARLGGDRPPEDAWFQPDPCVSVPLTTVVKRWHRERARDQVLPGVASYNNALVAPRRHVVVKVAVLEGAGLPTAPARRLAGALIHQFRELDQYAPSPVQKAVRKLFLERFHDRWKALGSPEPKR